MTSNWLQWLLLLAFINGLCQWVWRMCHLFISAGWPLLSRSIMVNLSMCTLIMLFSGLMTWRHTIAHGPHHASYLVLTLVSECKRMFFLPELDFLCHHISAHRIEPQLSKCDKIINWPMPKSTTDMWSFLGLVRYIAVFLPNLTDPTVVLTPLTTKDAYKNVP